MVNELLATTEHKTFAPLGEPPADMSIEPDVYSASLQLCEEFCGRELGAATVQATYQIPAKGTWILLPFRSYPLASILAVGDIVVDAQPTARYVTVSTNDGGKITVTYTETVPELVTRAVIRQANVFKNRYDFFAPEQTTQRLDALQLEQNPQYLTGLASDVRSMLSPYRRLSF